MARSRIVVAIAAALVMAACAPPLPPPTPAAVVVAPAPKVYTCEQQSAAGAELAGLPAGSILRVMINDYGGERRQLRAARGDPEPAGCPPSPAEGR